MIGSPTRWEDGNITGLLGREKFQLQVWNSSSSAWLDVDSVQNHKNKIAGEFKTIACNLDKNALYRMLDAAVENKDIRSFYL